MRVFFWLTRARLCGKAYESCCLSKKAKDSRSATRAKKAAEIQAHARDIEVAAARMQGSHSSV